MYKYSYFSMFAPCHKITEIYRNLFICSERQLIDALKNGYKFDVLIPLDSISADIWKYTNPKNIEIFYFPCPDYGTLSKDNLDYLVNKVVDYLANKKRVALFCLGGHGRTGYITACILGKMGVSNPVEVIRKKYCSKTIETSEQMQEVADYLKINLDKEIEILEMSKVMQWMKDQISYTLYGDSPTRVSQSAYLNKLSYDQLYKMCVSYGILDNEDEWEPDKISKK